MQGVLLALFLWLSITYTIYFLFSSNSIFEILPKILNTLLHIPKLLLLRPCLRPPQHHLRLQTPRLGHPKFRLDLLIDQGVIMLQVDAKPFGFERGPQHVLVHAVCLLGPAGEFVFVGFEFFLEGADGGCVFVEEDLRGEGGKRSEFVCELMGRRKRGCDGFGRRG